MNQHETKQLTTVPPGCEQVATGVWRLRILFVNVYFVATDDDQWVLIDAGLKSGAAKIAKTANQLFGDKPPAAIILTHGHFDHIGSLPSLLRIWDVKVYAHSRELPYLTGHAAYPPPDPGAGGGMMSWMSFLYPNEPVNLNNDVQALAKDGSIPFLTKWRYIHTPGHAPGHISLFRDADSVLIVGDAFVATHQESAFSVLLQRKQLSGPPKYFTYDWETAKTSVKKLQELNPAIAVTGHGKPFAGRELTEGLADLIRNFQTVAVPSSGRYVRRPALVNKRGVKRLPAAEGLPKATLIFSVAAAVAVVGGFAVAQLRRRY